jgi:thiol-disulfide isomerase/thioredoxin
MPDAYAILTSGPKRKGTAMFPRLSARPGFSSACVSRFAIALAVAGAFGLAPAVPGAQGRPSINGLWDAVIVTNGTEVPFRFEIATSGAEVQGSFFEGDRKVGSTSGTLVDGTLTLDYDFLNTTLELTLTGDQLIGAYRNKRPNARPQDVRMRRFAPVASGSDEPPQLAGSWEMRRKAEEATASRDTRTWHVFLRQSGADVSGSILRIDGDTGTLVGNWRDGKLVLSHFAGERPNLFEATLNPDGTLAVTLNGTAHYLVARTGDARAKGIPEPPDPSRYTSVKDPTTPFHFSFPDLTGQLVSDADARFRGKVVLLTIGGSWCPNCHDEAQYLAPLYKKYRDQGLEIVALDFEEPEQQDQLSRVKAFVKQYGVEYTYLIAGAPAEMWEKVPQAVNLNTWPATFFIGRDGLVKGIHAGFAAPASGKFNGELKDEFTSTIERLLQDGGANKLSAAGGE